MKKTLFLLFLLLVPFIAKAEVKITNVELVDFKEELEVEKNPSYEGLTIKFNLKFSEVEDFAKYKVTIKNETNKEYGIDDWTEFSKGEYVKYEFFASKETKIIKANDEEDFYIVITYNKQMPDELIKQNNGKYIEDNSMVINLSSNESEQVNPKTKAGLIIIVATIISALALIIILYNNHKIHHFTIPILLLLLIPITIYAIEKITIKLETKIEIVIPEDFFYIESRGCYYEMIYKDVKYRKGSTFNEFMNSDYFDALGNTEQEYVRTLVSEANRFVVWPKEYGECINNVERVPAVTYPGVEGYEEYQEYWRQIEECKDKYRSQTKNVDKDSIIEPQSKVVYEDIVWRFC